MLLDNKFSDICKTMDKTRGGGVRFMRNHISRQLAHLRHQSDIDLPQLSVITGLSVEEILRIEDGDCKQPFAHVLKLYEVYSS